MNRQRIARELTRLARELVARRRDVTKMSTAELASLRNQKAIYQALLDEYAAEGDPDAAAKELIRDAKKRKKRLESEVIQFLQDHDQPLDTKRLWDMAVGKVSGVDRRAEKTADELSLAWANVGNIIDFASGKYK